jgi:hypothetical protein
MTRKNDPHWVYRGFLRALRPDALDAHEKWQVERTGVGDPEVVADATARLDVIADEFRSRRRIQKRNGHPSPSIESLEIRLRLEREETEPVSS